MSGIRARLWVAFVLVVLVPVAAGTALMLSRVPAALEDQVNSRLLAGRVAITSVIGDLCRTAQLGADLVGRELAATTPSAAVADVASRDFIAYAAVRNARGEVLASGGTAPTTRSGQQAPGRCIAERIPSTTAGSYLLVAPVALHTADGRPQGSAVAGVLLPRDRLREISGGSNVDLTVVSAGSAVASTLSPREAAALAAQAKRASTASEPIRVGSRLAIGAESVPGGPLVLVSDDAPSRAGLEAAAAIVLAVALVLATAGAWLLTRLLTRPLVELADTAGRVAAGDLDARVEVRSDDEVGRVGAAFNEMTDELQTHIRALVASRDELRRNLSRLGDTLSSTHDLDRILGLILDAAMAATTAQAGAILLVSEGGGDLELVVGRGLDGRGVPDHLSLRLGEGITGRVAVRGEPVRGRIGTGALEPSAQEPTARAILSAPLRNEERVVGVLNLYDPDGADVFRDGDLVAIQSFAAQASVAVQNVLTHEEAQRLSITDGLTGLWNYRYLQVALDREIERASRFGRPLGVLMLDLDNFKQVNDVHGHQRGDAVLVELATRVHEVIRDVDVLARYGGEELVLLLPETDTVGASASAERICEAVRRTPFTAGGAGPPLHITVSVGVAAYPGHAIDAPGLIRAADEALYAAKAAGRDQWKVARATTFAAVQRRGPDG